MQHQHTAKIKPANHTFHSRYSRIMVGAMPSNGALSKQGETRNTEQTANSSWSLCMLIHDCGAIEIADAASDLRAARYRLRSSSTSFPAVSPSDDSDGGKMEVYLTSSDMALQIFVGFPRTPGYQMGFYSMYMSVSTSLHFSSCNPPLRSKRR
ncbi:hypothetical protein F5146DRAFT_341169 [Armillaria mellea]|nr:hypothetical protein F5146DRAFT_341169 [Armillaria mellea]